MISASRTIRPAGSPATIFPPRATAASSSRRFPTACRRACPASPSTPAARFSPTRALREGLATMFDFEWINANLYGGVYKRSLSFFDDSELSSAGRPARRAGARVARALPRRGARRHHGGTVGAADFRRFGTGPAAGAPRPRSRRASRLFPARRRAVERARRAARLRNPGQEPPGGAPRPRLFAQPRAHRRRGERAPRRRSAISAPPRPVRLRHDDRLVDRLALAGQRAARPLEFAGGDDGGLLQHLRRRLAGDRRR